METVEKTIEVDAPVKTVYNQWTQFEEFPAFMEGVEIVRQVDAKHLHWVVRVAGRRKEWDAEIVEQVPERRIAWRSISGSSNSGLIQFRPKDGGHTVVTLQMNYQPEGALESLGAAMGMLGRQVEQDLRRFRDFIHERQTETGAWRGEIHGDDVIPSSRTGNSSNQ